MAFELASFAPLSLFLEEVHTVNLFESVEPVKQPLLDQVTVGSVDWSPKV